MRIQVGDKVYVKDVGDRYTFSRRPIANLVGTVIGKNRLNGQQLAVDFPSFKNGHNCVFIGYDLSYPTSAPRSGWFLLEKELKLAHQYDGKSHEKVKSQHPGRRYQIIMEEWE